MADWTDWLQGLIGAGGAYLGSQAGGNQTTTQTNQPFPEWLGQWNAYTGLANQVANRPYQPNVAPFSQDQYQAMDQTRNLAGGGQEQRAGSQALQNFLGGPANNPYLTPAVNALNDQVQNRMSTGAFSSGSFGNAGVARQGAQAIAEGTNSLYNADLNRTASMVPQALNYQNQNLQNTSALLQSGAMQQNQGQRYLSDYLGYPMQQLQTMGMPLGFNTGQTQTSTVPGNTAASALGGGLLGLQIGGAVTGQTPPPRYTYPNFTIGTYNNGGGY